MPRNEWIYESSNAFRKQRARLLFSLMLYYQRGRSASSMPFLKRKRITRCTYYRCTYLSFAVAVRLRARQTRHRKGCAGRRRDGKHRTRMKALNIYWKRIAMYKRIKYKVRDIYTDSQGKRGTAGTSDRRARTIVNTSADNNR
jgi:hypothetical protein